MCACVHIQYIPDVKSNGISQNEGVINTAKQGLPIGTICTYFMVRISLLLDDSMQGYLYIRCLYVSYGKDISILDASMYLMARISLY